MKVSGKLPVVLALLALSAIASAQSLPLSGRVVDANGAGVAGATVSLYERDGRNRVNLATNGDGVYRFDRATPGEHLIEVTATGFAKATKLVRLNSGAETVNFTLGVAGINEEVIVTASGTVQSIDEVSKAVSIITAEEIEKRNEYLLAEALRTTPGIRVVQLSGPGQFTKVSFRGLRPQDTAVTVDGLRFRDAADTDFGGSATNFFSDLQLVNDDRVEVLRGSGAALYGSNATGGVINIVSGQGGGPLRGQAQFEGGGLGFTRARGTVSGGAFEDKLVYSVGAINMRLFRGVDLNDQARNTGVQGRAGWNITPLASLVGRVFASDSYVYTNESPFAAPGLPAPAPGSLVRAVVLPLDVQRDFERRGQRITATNYTRGDVNVVAALDDPDKRRDASFLSTALTYSQRFNEWASYRLSYHRIDTRRNFRDGPLGIGPFGEPAFANDNSFNGVIDTVNGRADFNLGLRNTSSVGYEYEHEGYDNPRSDTNPDPARRLNAFTSVRLRSHSFFAQHQTRLADDRLQLSAAVRTQGFNLSTPIFRGGPARYTTAIVTSPPRAYTGDASVSWYFRSTGTKLRAHAGNSYRAPSAFERFGSGYSVGAFLPYGEPEIKPERAVSFDAGMDQTLLNGRAKLGATFFYTRLQEVIQFLQLPQPEKYGRIAGGYTNIGGGLARGVELSAQFNPTRSLDVNASYTYTNADLRTTTRPGLLFIPGTAKHMFTLVVNQNIRRRWDVTFDFFATGEYSPGFPSPSSTSLYIYPGPKKGDLGLSYTLPLTDTRNLRFYVKVENVFNRQNFEDGYRTPKAWAIGGMAFKF